MSLDARRRAAAQAGVVAAVFAAYYTQDHRQQLEQLGLLKRSEIIAYAVCFHLVGHGLLVPAIPPVMLETGALPALDELPEHVRADMQRVLDAALVQQRFIDEKLGDSPGPRVQTPPNDESGTC
jgi:hypothetical protein